MVSRWTGIPVYKMLEEETKRLLNMEEILNKRIIGQNEAITLLPTRSAVQEPAYLNRKTDRNFYVLGPTGVGKTELAKAIAEFMFQSESAIVRLDMSEYMERHSVAKIIGSPPGYVGYEEGGSLRK